MADNFADDVLGFISRVNFGLVPSNLIYVFGLVLQVVTLFFDSPLVTFLTSINSLVLSSSSKFSLSVSFTSELHCRKRGPRTSLRWAIDSLSMLTGTGLQSFSTVTIFNYTSTIKYKPFSLPAVFLKARWCLEKSLTK